MITYRFILIKAVQCLLKLVGFILVINLINTNREKKNTLESARDACEDGLNMEHPI